MDFWEIYAAAVVGVFALIFGSFLNCAAMRIAKDEDFIHGRSRCPLCGHELGALELIPVISFVFLKGRCKHCGKAISVRYPLSETAFLILTEILYFRFGLGAVFIRDVVLTGALFTASLVDIACMRIPDGCLLIGLAAWTLSIPFMGYDLRQCIIFAASGAGCMAFMLIMALLVERATGKEALGGGDVKLFALLGLYLGPMGAYWLVLLSSIIGLAMAGFTRLINVRPKGAAMPFGPAICLAGYLLVLFGQDLSAWYINTFLG